jgi:hypothetical protein
MSRVKADHSPRARNHRAMGLVLTLVLLILDCCQPSRVLADPSTAKNAAKRAPLDASLAVLGESGDINGIVVVRVGEIFALPQLAKYAATVDAFLATQLKPLLGLPFNLPVKVEDIDQIAVRLSLKIEIKPVQKTTNGMVPTALRMKKPFDWNQFFKKEMPKAREVKKDGLTFYELDCALPTGDAKRPGMFQFYVADERTLVLDSATIAKMVEARKKPLPEPAWAADWKEVEGGLVAVLLSDPRHSYAAKSRQATLPPDLDPAGKELADLELQFASTMSRVVVGADADKAIRLSARFTCDKPADAAELEKACATFGKWLRRLPVPGPANAAAQQELFDGATIRRVGNQVIVTAKLGLERLGDLCPTEVYEPPPMPRAP